MEDVHTARIYFFADFEKLRSSSAELATLRRAKYLAKYSSGSSLVDPPPHWPTLPNLTVEDNPWRSWLPEDWGQALLTQPSGNKPVYISPQGKLHHAKTAVEKAVGKTLIDLDEDIPIDWPDWLPKDWGVTQKTLDVGKTKKIFVHPSLERYFWNKIDVEKFCSGTSRKLVNFRVGPGALPDDYAGAQPTQEPLMKSLKSSSTDSEVEGVGSDDEAESGCGYRIKPLRRRTFWLVLPDDVESVTLDLFDARIEASGWRCIRKGNRRYDFESSKESEHVQISLYAMRGRLLVRTTDRFMALSVANVYADLLCSE